MSLKGLTSKTGHIEYYRDVEEMGLAYAAGGNAVIFYQSLAVSQKVKLSSPLCARHGTLSCNEKKNETLLHIKNRNENVQSGFICNSPKLKTARLAEHR